MKDIPKFVCDRVGEGGCIVSNQQGISILSTQINKKIDKGFEQAKKNTEMSEIINEINAH